MMRADRPDGSGNVPVRLTARATPFVGDFASDWSPEGKTTAFVPSIRDGISDVWIMNADGSHKRNMTKGSSPSWSPDGERIALASGEGAIWVMDADGSDKTRLTEEGYNSSPAWQPRQPR